MNKLDCRSNRLFVLTAAVVFSLPSIAFAAEEPEWYLPVSDGCRIYVRELGVANPTTVVVLHGGFGAEHSYLLDPLGPLASNYHMVFFDQRGSLRSPCPPEQVSVEKFIDDLERLRSELRSRKILLIGHSRGAYLALEYQRKQAEHVLGLVLLGPASLKTPMTAEDQHLMKESDDRARAFLLRPEIAVQLKKEGLAGDVQELTAKQKSYAWRIRFAGANVYHVERWREMKGGQAYFNEKSGAAAAKTLPAAWDFTPGLAASQCPISVILGDHDIVDFGGAMHRKWMSDLPNARLAILKAAGHNVWIDAPEDFQHALWTSIASMTQVNEK